MNCFLKPFYRLAGLLLISILGICACSDSDGTSRRTTTPSIGIGGSGGVGGSETPEIGAVNSPPAGIIPESISYIGTVDEFLTANPNLQSAMIWETASGTRLPYRSWPQSQKDRLNEFFQKMLRGERDLGIDRKSTRLNSSH